MNRRPSHLHRRLGTKSYSLPIMPKTSGGVGPGVDTGVGVAAAGASVSIACVGAGADGEEGARERTTSVGAGEGASVAGAGNSVSTVGVDAGAGTATGASVADQISHNITPFGGIEGCTRWVGPNNSNCRSSSCFMTIFGDMKGLPGFADQRQLRESPRNKVFVYFLKNYEGRHLVLAGFYLRVLAIVMLKPLSGGDVPE